MICHCGTHFCFFCFEQRHSDRYNELHHGTDHFGPWPFSDSKPHATSSGWWLYRASRAPHSWPTGASDATSRPAGRSLMQSRLHTPPLHHTPLAGGAGSGHTLPWFPNDSAVGFRLNRDRLMSTSFVARRCSDFWHQHRDRARGLLGTTSLRCLCRYPSWVWHGQGYALHSRARARAPVRWDRQARWASRPVRLVYLFSARRHYRHFNTPF